MKMIQATSKEHRRQLWRIVLQGMIDGPRQMFAPLRGAFNGARDEIRREWLNR
jgi:hypothetical protein